MSTILKVNNLKKYYGKNSSNITKAVNGINFNIEKQEFVAIMGASGSGYGYVMVASDEVINNLKINSTHLIVNTTKPTTEKFANELVNMKEDELCEEDEAGFNIYYALSNITVRGMEEANNNSFITITAFLCFYIYCHSRYNFSYTSIK